MGCDRDVRAVAASRTSATDFLAPVFAAQVKKGLRWSAILTDSSTADDAGPHRFFSSEFELVDGLGAKVADVARFWPRYSRIGENSREWLEQTYASLGMDVLVFTYERPRAFAKSLFVPTRGKVCAHADSLRVSNKPWLELCVEGGLLRGHSTNLFTLQYGILGHGPWYLPSDQACGLSRDVLHVEYEEFVEPLRPVDPHRSALHRRRLTPSGSHLFDYSESELLNEVILASLSPILVRLLPSLVPMIEYASRRLGTRAAMSHALRVVDTLRPGVDRIDAIQGTSLDVALGVVSLSKRARGRLWASGGTCRFVRGGEWALARTAVEQILFAVEALEDDPGGSISDANERQLDRLFLGSFDGIIGRGQPIECNYLGQFELRLRKLLAKLLMLWWRLVERRYRATLPILRRYCTPGEIQRSVARILGGRSGEIVKRLALTNCWFEDNEGDRHGRNSS